MKHRIVSGLVLVPLMIVLSTTPAYAIFGSIIAAIQRAQMIVNQGVQIYNDAMEKITMDGQLTELTDQFSHLKDQALGTVGALTAPFTDLSSIPTEFIGAGLSWKNDFTGVAGELAGAAEQLGESGTSFTDAWRDRLTASNTISESDFLSLYAAQSPEVGAAASRVYLAAAEAGDKKLVMAHAQSDAAKNLMVAAKEAVSSYEGLRNNTNTSNTALQQAMVAGTERWTPSVGPLGGISKVDSAVVVAASKEILRGGEPEGKVPLGMFFQAVYTSSGVAPACAE